MDIYSRENVTGHDQYLCSIAPRQRWEMSYVRPGHAEISDVLAFENTIPNISACLVHRQSALRALKAIRYRIVGDWVFYVTLLSEGRVAYCREQLNLHRRHATSIVTRLESRPIFHIERAGAHMHALLAASLGPSEADRMIELQNTAYDRLVNSRQPGAERRYLDLMQQILRETAQGRVAENARRVLVIIPDLHIGGGQMAGIRLANALAKRHYVWLYAVDHSEGHGSLAGTIDRRVGILPEGGFEQLASLLEAAQIEIISSHVWWADKLAFHLKRERPEVKWLITMHGCYERLLEEPNIDPWFRENAECLLNTADGIVYLADKNLEVFNYFGISTEASRVRKIYNGLEINGEISSINRRRSKNGSNARSFVLVGRGIEEKGWREAAEALRQTNSRLASEGRQLIELRFVGSGDYLAEMKQDYRFEDLPIRYVGSVSDVFPVLAEADVGLLPSCFPQESLPNAVAEYLVCGLPAIVSDMGEMPNMIASERGEAGIVIGFKRGRADVGALAGAMYTYAANPEVFAEHAQRTVVAARKFRMKHMIQQYSDLIGMCLTDADDLGNNPGEWRDRSYPLSDRVPGLFSG
jgi:glycosyltransferase involved in cell wall biosynthesis